ncbi:hypothetical protein RJ640_000443, partial [Escallonia rubra]
MWKLVLSQGNEPWLKSVNHNIGRQYWEFDAEDGTPDERAHLETLRTEFHENRFNVKQSSDLLMRYQFERGHPGDLKLPSQKVRSEEDITEVVVANTLRKALRFYSTLQAEDGQWPGDYGGPLFLLPGLVISLSVMGVVDVVLPNEHQKEICRYAFNHQNADGGWGLHIEGPSTMFGTVLNYVTLRLLGVKLNGGDGAMDKARKWILDHGGATYISSWGKLWLS